VQLLDDQHWHALPTDEVVDLLETDNLLYKVVGMQLMVENTALALFKMIGDAKLEPVLTDLLYYFERDEARHVGLGVLTLPPILEELSQREAIALWGFQMKIQLMMLAGGLTLREPFQRLGVDQRAMEEYGMRLHHDILRRMKKGGDDRGVKSIKGLFRLSRSGQDTLTRILFPDDSSPAWHKGILGAMTRAADRGDRWLAARAPA